MRWVFRTVRGLMALAVLIAIVGGVPALLVRTAGNPWPGRSAFDLRDDRAILIGALAAVAWVVWARFVLAVIREVVVQAHRARRPGSRRGPGSGGPSDVVEPVVPPSGGLAAVAQRLVGLVLAALPLAPIGASPLPLRVVGVAVAASPAEAAAHSPIAGAPVGRALPEVAVGANDSLLQIAERHLGDRGRWREIFELNADRVQAGGGRLTTPGSLRAGWVLALPADATIGGPSPADGEGQRVEVAADPVADAAAELTYVVVAGDSYWSIAAAELSIGGRTPTDAAVAHRTEELLRANAARLGHADPTLLLPGEVLLLPAAAGRGAAAGDPTAMPAGSPVVPDDAPGSPADAESDAPGSAAGAPSPAAGASANPVTPFDAAAPTHVVVAGESYWSIAAAELGRTLDRAPTAAETREAAEALVALNGPLFGYPDPTLVRPGDELVLAPGPDHDVEVPTTDAAEVPVTSMAPSAPAVDRSGDPAGDGAEPAAAAVDPERATEPERPAAPPVADGAVGGSAVGADTAATDGLLAADDAPAPEGGTDAGGSETAERPDVAGGESGAAAEPPDGASGTSAASIPEEVPAAGAGPARGEVAVAAPAERDPVDSALLGRPRTSGSSTVPLGVGGAVLVAGGALAVVEARRRAALRRVQAYARLAPADPSPIGTALRSLGADERLVRLDLATRALAVALRDRSAQPLVARVETDGTVAALLSDDASLPRPWVEGDGRWWSLPGTIELEMLAPLARGAGVPCPAFVHVGRSGGADVFVDVEAVGALAVDGPPEATRAVLDAAALGLALSPFALDAQLVFTGVAERVFDVRHDTDPVPDVGAATHAARAVQASVLSATAGDASPFALRARSSLERWEPAIVVLGAGLTPPEELVTAALGATRARSARPGESGTTVHGDDGEGTGVVPGAGPDVAAHRRATGRGGIALVAAAPFPSPAPVTLRATADGWVLEPFGIRLDPVGIEADEIDRVVRYVETSTVELLDPEPAEPAESADVAVPAAAAAAAVVEREWELLVRVLGGVRVHDGAGVDAVFERSKALELVSWLALHRHRPTRTAARTALWEVDVRDATFANVVSDARRNLARLVPPPDGEEWIGRTLSESLPIHPLVVSDADLLADRVAAARPLAPAEAVGLLRPGLALVTDLPFAGTGYLWPDAEGVVTELVLTIITAAVEMARHCLDLGDVDGVFWATGQGLKVLAGHEELVSLRMRAHARAGDLAAVRAEWASYERALAADPWDDAEPSPKLVELRRELLGAAVPATAA